MMEKNVYATNKGGYIPAPFKNTKDEPRATSTVAHPKGDLRGGK